MIVQCHCCGSTFQVAPGEADDFTCPDCPDSVATFVTHNAGLAASESVLYPSGEFTALSREPSSDRQSVRKRDKLTKLREDLAARRAAR